MKGTSYQFIDKNGVINGIRAKEFALPDDYWGELIDEGLECSKNCKQEPPDCAFMKKYASYLDTLDFNNIINRCEMLAANVQKQLGFKEEPIIVLMVYEPASCNCAERPVIQNWFKKNGFDVKEWAN